MLSGGWGPQFQGRTDLGPSPGPTVAQGATSRSPSETGRQEVLPWASGEHQVRSST